MLIRLCSVTKNDGAKKVPDRISKYTVLCIQNTANVVAIHDKAQKDAKIEEKREAVAKRKANKVCVLVPKQLSVNSVPSFDCANPNCAIMFWKSKWLEKHTAAAKRKKM